MFENFSIVLLFFKASIYRQSHCVLVPKKEIYLKEWSHRGFCFICEEKTMMRPFPFKETMRPSWNKNYLFYSFFPRLFFKFEKLWNIRILRSKKKFNFYIYFPDDSLVLFTHFFLFFWHLFILSNKPFVCIFLLKWRIAAL